MSGLEIAAKPIVPPRLVANIALMYALLHLLSGVAMIVVIPGTTAIETLLRVREALSSALLIAAIAALVLGVDQFVTVMRQFVLARKG